MAFSGAYWMYSFSQPGCCRDTISEPNLTILAEVLWWRRSRRVVGSCDVVATS
jgi:hypothetical protein